MADRGQPQLKRNDRNCTQSVIPPKNKTLSRRIRGSIGDGGHHDPTLVYQIDADCKRLRWIEADGFREAKASWLDALRDLQARGLTEGPRLDSGDGALGVRAALDEVYGET